MKGATQYTDHFDLYDYLGDDSWACVFMHPGDFTPVCTTELGMAALMSEEFKGRNVKLIGFSCNDSTSHREWIEDIEVATGGKVDFPLFCDPTREHAVKLGILDEDIKDDEGLPLTVRAVYILKPKTFKIALMMVYPASSGRNFDEIIRSIDSIQLTANHFTATPANWKKGEEVLVNFPLSDSFADQFFGEDGYRIVEVPSEKGKDIPKHYLRYTADSSSGESFWKGSDDDEATTSPGFSFWRRPPSAGNQERKAVRRNSSSM